MNCLMLSLIHFQGNKESGKTFFFFNLEIPVLKWAEWKQWQNLCVCVCMHTWCMCLWKQKSNCWFLFFSKCQECKVLAMFSGRALPSLDVTPRCTEELGTARWPYSTCFIFLRGADVVQWKQEEESNWKGHWAQSHGNTQSLHKPERV